MSGEERWYEKLHAGSGQYFSVSNRVAHKKTGHHLLEIFETPDFGRVMALDGIVQTTERDEFIYHEMMAHVPLFAHGRAKRVLIVGGGDGAMLREVSRHKDIEHITMVEIDKSVVEFCRQYLPNHSAGAYNDPRLSLVFSDGKEFVENSDQKFDVIISDCTDPIGFGENLFTSAFYAACARCLNEDGIFVAQNGVCFLQQTEVITSYSRLKSYFSDVSFYQTAIPTYYGGIMTMAWATQNAALRQRDYATLQARLNCSDINFGYYNADIHIGSFALPQYIRNVLATVG